MVWLLLAFWFAVLAVTFFAATALVQGYWYDTPTDGIAWRAPAAAAAITAFFALWSFVELKAPGQYDTFANFSAQSVTQAEQLWSERKTDQGVQEFLYVRKVDGSGRTTFIRQDDGKPWRRSDSGIMAAIIVEENGERKRFEAELNPSGTFKLDRDGYATYREVGGACRTMGENSLGRLTVGLWGRFFLNVLLNLAHLAAWWLALWLLLKFQPGHAFGIAAILFAAASLLVWPIFQARLRG